MILFLDVETLVPLSSFPSHPKNPFQLDIDAEDPRHNGPSLTKSYQRCQRRAIAG